MQAPKYNRSMEKNHLIPETYQEVIAQAIACLKDIRYGSIEMVVHDGRVVQIDKRERFRINPPTKKQDTNTEINS